MPSIRGGLREPSHETQAKEQWAVRDLSIAILNTPAWRAMSPLARLLWIELRRKLSGYGDNNGKIYLSDRDAAEAIGADKNTIGRKYAELEHFGFLRKTSKGCLGSDGYGIAPHYRFTDLVYGTRPATRDYEKWSGELFAYKPAKKQKPVCTVHTPRMQNAYIRDPASTAALCMQNADIRGGPRCMQNAYISRIAISQDN